ncbi:hypothetical protein HDV57DRAFT_143827 [Trichoderma longibrachiatum]
MEPGLLIGIMFLSFVIFPWVIGLLLDISSASDCCVLYVTARFVWKCSHVTNAFDVWKRALSTGIRHRTLAGSLLLFGSFEDIAWSH